MGNCLVTKLKETVSGNLLEMGEILVKKDLRIDGVCEIYNGTERLVKIRRLAGDAPYDINSGTYLTDEQLAEGIWAGTNLRLAENTVLAVKHDYNLTEWHEQFTAGTPSDFKYISTLNDLYIGRSGSMASLKDMTLTVLGLYSRYNTDVYEGLQGSLNTLTKLYIYSKDSYVGEKLYLNASQLGSFPNLNEISCANSLIGDIEDFVTAKIACRTAAGLAAGGSATFIYTKFNYNGVLYNNERNTVTWDAQGNITIS